MASTTLDELKALAADAERRAREAAAAFAAAADRPCALPEAHRRADAARFLISEAAAAHHEFVRHLALDLQSDTRRAQSAALETAPADVAAVDEWARDLFRKLRTPFEEFALQRAAHRFEAWRDAVSAIAALASSAS